LSGESSADMQREREGKRWERRGNYWICPCILKIL